MGMWPALLDATQGAVVCIHLSSVLLGAILPIGAVQCAMCGLSLQALGAILPIGATGSAQASGAILPIGATGSTVWGLSPAAVEREASSC